jgi:hypothetical protein
MRPPHSWRGRRFRFVCDAFHFVLASSTSHPRQQESCRVSRARVPYLVGQRLPRPYHFPARIQSFQALAAPFPGDSGCPQRLAQSSRRPKRIAARQGESRRVSRAPVYHILWVPGFRDHTISRRGFNLFKRLRRHFRHFPATPCCPQRFAPRSRRPRRVGSKDRRSARRPPPGRRFGTNVEQRRSSGKEFVERLRSWFALSFRASDLPLSEGTHSRGRAGNPQTSDSHGF